MCTVSAKNSTIAILRAVYIGLSTLLFAVSYFYKAHFLVGCLICTISLCFIQIRLIFISGKDEEHQKQKCRSIGFILLFPALGMIANGIGLLFLPDYDIPILLHYGIIVILAVMLIGLSAHIFVFRKDSALAAKFLRFTDCAALSPPTALIVLMILNLSQSEDSLSIGCMTAVLFGVMSLSIAANMILTSYCGYISTRESIKIVSELMRSKKLLFFRAIVVKDGCLVAGKLLISIASLSFFMFVNTLYSVGMGVGRIIAVKMHERSIEEQLKDYRKVGGVILFSSVCYVLYSIRLFFGGKSPDFPMVIALVIALYTFIEFGVNIHQIFLSRKSKALDAKAIRALSFSSTLLCFVLTQTAIMSFAHDGDASFSNALSGVVFGGLAAMVGLYVILSVKHIPDE